MFKFIKQIFVSTTLMFFGSLSNVNPLEYVLMNNQECKVRPEFVNLNCSEPLFYPLSSKTSEWNVVVLVTILMIPMQNCVFLMWLKI